jgi:hypothetical protein
VIVTNKFYFCASVLCDKEDLEKELTKLFENKESKQIDKEVN